MAKKVFQRKPTAYKKRAAGKARINSAVGRGKAMGKARARSKSAKKSRGAPAAGNSVGKETSVSTVGPKAMSQSLKTLTKASPPSFFYYNYTGCGIGGEGVQTLTNLGGNFTAGWLNKCFTAGTQATGAITGGSTSRSVPLQMKTTYRIKNQQNEDAYCIIYDCTPKECLANALDPITQWQAGYTDAQGTTVMSDTFINAKPTQSERFKAMWTVHKTTKFMLAPGAQHLHVSNTLGNRVFKAEAYANGDQYLKNWTCNSFIVVYGGPCDGGAASTAVTTSATKVIFTADVVLSYKVFAANSTNFNMQNTFSTALASENAMDEATGAAVIGAAA